MPVWAFLLFVLTAIGVWVWVYLSVIKPIPSDLDTCLNGEVGHGDH